MKLLQLDIEGFRSLFNVSWKPGINPLRDGRHYDALKTQDDIAFYLAGIHLSRDTLQANRRGISLGALASCRLLTGVDALGAGEDASAPRIGLSRLKWVAGEIQ